MKHLNSDISEENQQMAKAFVLAAFEKKQLAEQIDSLYETVDNLGANLDVESRQKLFENTSEYMKKLGARLVEIEQDLSRMLPDFIEYTSSLDDTDATHLKTDNTMPFATGNTTPISSINLPQPMAFLKFAPEKPTLIAIEPAPMVDEDEDCYQFEDDEDIDLTPEPTPTVFDTPAPPLTPYQTATHEMHQADLDGNNKEVIPDVLKELLSPEQDDHLTWERPSENGTVAEINDEGASEFSAIDNTEPVRLHSAMENDTVAQNKAASKNDSEDSWNPPPATASDRKQTMPYGEESETSSEHITGSSSIPKDAYHTELTAYSAPPGGLAAILEPDASENSLEAEADFLPSDNYESDVSDASIPPDKTYQTTHNNPVDDDMETIARGSEYPTLNAEPIIDHADREASILFWKQNATQLADEQGDNVRDRNLNSNIPAVSPDQLFTLSRIPSLLPREVISDNPLTPTDMMAANFDDEHGAPPQMEHDVDISNQKESGFEDEDPTGKQHQEELSRSNEVEMQSPLERELYEMLDLHSVPANPISESKQHKQTLIGIAAIPTDDVNDISTDHKLYDDENDAISNEENHQ